MKHRILLFLLSWVTLTLHAQQSGDDLLPLIWLRADLPGDSVSVWQDISGHGYHAGFQSCSQPDTVLFNYNKAFLVDVSTPGFRIDYRAAGTGTITVFTVYKSADTATEQAIWHLGIDTAGGAGLTTHKMLTVARRIQYTTTTTCLPLINTMIQNWRNRTVDTANSFMLLAGDDSLGFLGKFAEFILFEGVLPANQFNRIHTYLAIKYGISLKTRNYVSGEDEIVWDQDQNRDYAVDIAGIACDTTLGLLQKQASGNGGDAPLIIAAGSLAESNEDNASLLQHGDFLIWGDNALPMEVAVPDTTIPVLPVLEHLLQRRWLMQATGSTPHLIPTQLSLKAELPDSAIITALVREPSSTGKFYSDSVIIHYPDSVDAQGCLWFNGIFWDTDRSGSDVFTFQVYHPALMPKITHLQNQAGSSGDTTAFYRQSSSHSGMRCRLFPNPTPNHYSLVIALDREERVMLTLFDQTGRTVDEQQLPKGKLHHYEGYLEKKGVYMIRVKTGGEERTYKLIVN